jgi:hypothetical protein
MGSTSCAPDGGVPMWRNLPSPVIQATSAHGSRSPASVRYLFLHNGRLAHPDYLFAAPLRPVCDTLWILNGAGKPAIDPHCFIVGLLDELGEPHTSPDANGHGS